MQDMTPSTDELLVRVKDGVAVITLNRPQAINALTLGMVRDMRSLLTTWASDGSVRLVELNGAGERGFCSGADVRWVRERVLADEPWLEFFAEEFKLNAQLATYPKPVRARMSGITMGGGLGLSAHDSERIVDATSKLAMPETNIGFTPDVGMAYPLSHAPGRLGYHVALTGSTFGAGDALAMGLADRFDGKGVPASPLAKEVWIADCYDASSAVEAVWALERHAEPAARAAAQVIRSRCPLSVAVTFEALRRAERMGSVAEVLRQDLVLAESLIAQPDFAEGVRAQLVDKDNRPRWRHARLEDVTDAEITACF